MSRAEGRRLRRDFERRYRLSNKVCVVCDNPVLFGHGVLVTFPDGHCTAALLCEVCAQMADAHCPICIHKEA